MFAIKNIPWVRKATVPLRFTFSEKKTGAAIDLTSSTLMLTTNTEPDPPADDRTNEIFQLTGSIVGDPKLGVCDFEMSESQADRADRIFYEVLMYTAGAKRRPLVRGELRFSESRSKEQTPTP